MQKTAKKTPQHTLINLGVTVSKDFYNTDG